MSKTKFFILILVFLLVSSDFAVARQSTEFPHKIPAPAPEKWQGLIGNYVNGKTDLLVLEKQGKLYLYKDKNYYPLKEVDVNKFQFALDPSKFIYFERNAVDVAFELKIKDRVFKRDFYGIEEGKTYKIKPVKPVSQLRKTALSAAPPGEKGSFKKSHLVSVADLEPSIKLDIRYATKNNFMGEAF
ncbi:MAG: hypothetical protein ACLFQV_07715, partial [Vulcanimicrobiota bacterium]